MNNRFYFFLAVTIFVVTAICSTCKKKLLCADSVAYYFSVNTAMAYPAKDSIRTGDTLFVSIGVPFTLKDTLTNQLINFANADAIGNTPAIGKFTGGSISDPGSTGAVSNFDYIVKEGQMVNSSINNTRIQLAFAKGTDSFYLKLELIPKNPGTFYFAISDDAGVHPKGDNCTRASITFRFSNVDQHLYLYQQNRPGYTISDYEASHMYCFKVY